MCKQFVKLFLIVSAAMLLALFIPACGGHSGGTLSFDELIADPGKYNNKTITVEAFYFSGFEINALTGSLTLRAGSDTWIPVPPNIWFSGAIPQSVLDRVYTQTETPSGYPERYGRIRVTGIFEYGGAYGHLDAYAYRIIITDAEYLSWTPS